jgi:hypothetical protein
MSKYAPLTVLTAAALATSAAAHSSNKDKLPAWMDPVTAPAEPQTVDPPRPAAQSLPNCEHGHGYGTDKIQVSGADYLAFVSAHIDGRGSRVEMTTANHQEVYAYGHATGNQAFVDQLDVGSVHVRSQGINSGLYRVVNNIQVGFAYDHMASRDVRLSEMSPEIQHYMAAAQDALIKAQNGTAACSQSDVNSQQDAQQQPAATGSAIPNFRQRPITNADLKGYNLFPSHVYYNNALVDPRTGVISQDLRYTTGGSDVQVTVRYPPYGFGSYNNIQRFTVDGTITEKDGTKRHLSAGGDVDNFTPIEYYSISGLRSASHTSRESQDSRIAPLAIQIAVDKDGIWNKFSPNSLRNSGVVGGLVRKLGL